MKFKTKNVGQTLGIAKRLGKILNSADLVAFQGTLGSGKTTFIKGIAQAVGVKKEVTSASFVILKQYKGRFVVYHADLYRLRASEVPDEVHEIIFAEDGLALVEWSERIEIPRAHFKVTIELVSLESRKITIDANCSSLKKRLKKL